MELVINNSTATNFDPGYGHGSRAFNSAPRPVEMDGTYARGYWVPKIAIDIVKDFLRKRNNLFYALPSREMADSMALYCESRSRGDARDDYMNSVIRFLSQSSQQDAFSFVTFQGSLMSTSEHYICPQFKD